MPTAIADLYPLNLPDVPPQLSRPTLRYRVQALLVMASLFLFLAVYLSLIAGCAAVGAWAGIVLFDLEALKEAYGPAGATLLGTLICLAGVISASLMLYFLKGLFKFRHPDPSYLEITAAAQPRLFAFIRQMCADTGAPMPARILVSPEVNAGVFHACTFWGLFFPAHKDLHIGLGLVNCLNLVEFKAVLAHEFGHFSQKTTRLGTYVYTANQIIRDLVYGRDWLDNSLSVLDPVLNVLRWHLGILFRVLNFAHASLCRQMEFQADLVAVSLTGSDAIIHGLLRSDFAHQCLETTWQDLAAAADHGLQSDDVFHHQSHAAEYLRILKDEPALGMPPELPADPVLGPAVFPPDLTVLPPMWASHPPHYEREQNCKRVYLRSPQDDRSAWLLFDDAEALRRQVTRRHLHRARRDPPLEVQPAEVVQRFIDEERAEVVYSARYHGMYEEGFISPGPVDLLMPSAPSRYEQPARLLAEHTAVFCADLRARLKDYRKRREDHRRLSRFVQKVEVPRGGVFAFREKDYRTAEAPKLLELLEREIKADREHLAALDRRIFLVYLGMARQLHAETAGELERRYRFQLAVQEMIGSLGYWQRQVEQAFQGVAGQREPDPAAVQTLVAVLARAQDALDNQFAVASQLRLPALKNMRAGEPLSFFLDARPTIRGFIGAEQWASGTWIKQMIERQAEAIDKLRRILFKSLGSLLSFQERVGEEWKGKYAAPGACPGARRGTRASAT
jgi:Zn-dependent protease with chaperone function